MSRNLKTYLRLLSYVKPYRHAFYIALLGNILYAVVDASLVKFLEPLMNKGFVARDPFFIQIIPIAVIVIFFLRGTANFMTEFFMGWVARHVVRTLRQELFMHYLKLPASFYDTQSSGELISVVTYNVEQVAEASSESLTECIREGLTAIFLLAVMFSVSGWLTGLFLITVPVVAILMYRTSRRLRRVSMNVQRSMGSVTRIVQEVIEGYKVVRIFGGQTYEKKRFFDTTTHNRHQEMKLITTTAISVPTVQMVGALALALTLYLATRQTHSFGPFTIAAISPGGFTAMITAMLAMLRPIKQLTKVNTKIQKGVAGAQSIFELLDTPVEEDSGTLSMTRAKGQISFEQVSFAYSEGGAPVLKDLNLDIHAGETLAIVGRSGSGKTSLVNLLPRFYEAEGLITLDGCNVRDIKLQDLREQFALVSQHITIFNDSILRNITYGLSREVPFEEVVEAARKAHALEFIEKLPHGFDTFVGEHGLKLSGGQRQRLAIARAILKNAPVLILDEATSALDSESERLIQDAMDELIGNRTTLVIAHRLSTIEKADRIIVLEAGRIVEMGTHEALLRLDGHYAFLRRLQFDAPLQKTA